MSSTWKRLDSRTVYDNHWISVRHDQVINPRGGKNDYGVVKFKNRAIGVIPLDAEQSTWLVGQHRYPTGVYSWEIPMGGSPLAEDPLLGGQRELREETGITAQSWEKILEVHLSNCITDEIGIVYVARDLTFGETAFDETEDLQLRMLPVDDAVAMVMTGEIVDALSVAALLKLQLMLRDLQNR